MPGVLLWSQKLFGAAGPSGFKHLMFASKQFSSHKHIFFYLTNDNISFLLKQKETKLLQISTADARLPASAR